MTESTPGRKKADVPSSTPAPVIPDFRRYLPTAVAGKDRTEIPLEQRYSVYISRADSRLALIYAESPLGSVVPRPVTLSDHRIDQPGIEYFGRTEVPLGISVGVFPTDTSEQNLKVYREFIRDTLTPLGIVHLREHAQAVRAVHMIDNAGVPSIEVFAQPLPSLTEAEVDSIRETYALKRRQLRHNKYDLMSDHETRYDRALLFSEEMEKRTRRKYAGFEAFFDRIDEVYATRMDNLHEGFVTLEQTFSLTEVPQTDNPDLITIGNRFYLPNLPSLYFVYQLEQAGFDVRLSVRSDSSRLPLPPSKKSFAIMIRPKLEAES